MSTPLPGPDNDLQHRLQQLAQQHRLRTAQAAAPPPGWVDLTTNDYLGLLRDPAHQAAIAQAVQERAATWGSGGSRLLGGQADLWQEFEAELAHDLGSPAALCFGSGYAANLAFWSAVPTRHDTVLFDRNVHASIRDGLRLGPARSLGFAHNNLNELEHRLKQARGRVYVTVESLYSMDGDVAPLNEMAQLCQQHGAHLVVDEAHALGVLGPRGHGLVAQLGLQAAVWARMLGFGKAMAAQGGAWVGSPQLVQWLATAARPFIYTTAPPPALAVAVRLGWQALQAAEAQRTHLQHLVAQLGQWGLPNLHTGPGAIAWLQVPGAPQARHMAARLQQEHLFVKPVVAPTVAEGTERIRLVLHSYNTTAELLRLADAVRAFAGAAGDQEG